MGGLSLTLIIITFFLAIFGLIEKVVPPDLFPRWATYTLILITAIAAGLTLYRDLQQLLSTGKELGGLATGIEPSADAPKKNFTPNQQQIYAEVRNNIEQFRGSPVRSFFATSTIADMSYKLALIQFNQRNFLDAEVNLRYALKLDSEHKDSYNLLLQLYQTEAMQFLQKGDYEGAEGRLKSADDLLEKIPQGIDNKTIALIGYLYKSLGQVYAKSDMDRAKRYWEQAEKTFKLALDLNENDPNAINGLGNILYFQGQYLKALEKHKEALRLASNYTSAANDAALVSEALMCQSLVQQKDSEVDKWRLEAISFWDKALQLSPSDPLFNQSYVYSISYRVNTLQKGRISEICK